FRAGPPVKTTHALSSLLASTSFWMLATKLVASLTPVFTKTNSEGCPWYAHLQQRVFPLLGPVTSTTSNAVVNSPGAKPETSLTAGSACTGACCANLGAIIRPTRSSPAESAIFRIDSPPSSSRLFVLLHGRQPCKKVSTFSFSARKRKEG